MNPVETYLKDLGEIMRTGGGTAEESYYGAFENLLNEIGKKLKPQVRCVSQMANTGAGEPDFGLYTKNQFLRDRDERPMKGQPPERGVIECKSWDDDSFAQTKSAQISKYWEKYKLVLVTNYHDFVLVGSDAHGKPVRLESYRLAGSVSAFRSLLAHPQKAAKEQGERLIDFLRRAVLHNTPLTDPKDLAWFFASYAREARARVEEAADLPALGGLKKALEDALGMKFESKKKSEREKGEHFFRSTLVQTLFYGVFSSWVLWSRDHSTEPGARFSWREAGWTLHVPMIATLFSQIAVPQKLKPLRVDEVLDWAGLALDRVDREAFFAKFEEEHAVQYFYEPFLQAYDPELRKTLGVWYTPPEIVRYQVERIDRVLREELEVADGLADDQVVILDPCCGTGAYLVETLRRVKKTLDEKGKSALTAQKLKKAVMERIFGFEILPAPFVVSHLQIGLVLRNLGAPLDRESNERAGVYLTNALTGWEPPEKPKDELPLFPELMEERDRANRIKREAPILVVLGNPPYNAFAGTSPEEEGGLVEPYKEKLTTPVKDGGWGIKKFNLDDPYVRFLRIAERRIAKSGKGVVSYISNYSWTQESSFVVLRKRLLEVFDKFWIENMHGNRKISEYAPDGHTSETIFAIPRFSVGIKQGVVISLWVRKKNHKDGPGNFAKVLYRDDLTAAKAVERRRQLLDSLQMKDFEKKYQTANPNVTNRFSFRPSTVEDHYIAWPLLTNFQDNSFLQGMDEDRANALICINEKPLVERMKAYFDSSIPWNEFAGLNTGLSRPSAAFEPEKTRARAQQGEKYSPTNLKSFLFRVFDKRFCYYSAVPNVWKRCRPDLFAQSWDGNSFLLSRAAGVSQPEGVPFFFTKSLFSRDCMRGHAASFPNQVLTVSKKNKPDNGMSDMFGQQGTKKSLKANLSKVVRSYLIQLGISDPDEDATTAGLIWMHSLAIGYSPAYLEENADGIRQDWPRIPLPNSKNGLLKSAELGRRVAALLDIENPVPGITTGKIDPLLKSIGEISRVGGGSLNPDVGELDITAGWGHGGKDGVCMPGQGKYEVRGQKEEGQKKAFGKETLDIYLNDTAYWANVPREVWEFHIGGYQVIKKWLSYREKDILGRGLKIEEAEYVAEMARRIAALILMQPDLDANYQAVKADTWPWPKE